MWRYPFLNLAFLFLVLALLSLQHSLPAFGPGGRRSDAIDNDSQTFDITSYAKSNDLHLPADFNRAVTYLSELWHRGMILKEWSLEYNAFQWELFRASSTAESDLLDARFHIANAEVFMEAMPRNVRAIKELDRAESSIRAAETVLGPRLAGQVKTIDDEITIAETSDQTADASAMLPLERIKAHLDHLIAVVRSAKLSGESSRPVAAQG
ncbi:MAG TPA: hypothetical protein VIE89_19730 [Candidatus Binatia bacterium]|jgi:hypothetical protein